MMASKKADAISSMSAGEEDLILSMFNIRPYGNTKYVRLPNMGSGSADRRFRIGKPVHAWVPGIQGANPPVGRRSIRLPGKMVNIVPAMSYFEQILRYQKRNRLASHLLFWLVVLLISVVSAKYYDGNEFTLSWGFTGSGLYLINQVIATYFLTYFIIPQLFFSKRYGLALTSFIVGSYLICVLARFIIVRIAEPLAGQAPKASETNMNILTDLPKLIFVYFFHIFSLAFVFLFIKLLKDQLEIQRRALTLEKDKAATELKLLKAQLNPHFLFNTLNNIYSLSLMGSPATSESIGRLAEILDYILYRCNNLLVPLSGELALLNNYICLEKLRYDERLKVNFTIGGQEAGRMHAGSQGPAAEAGLPEIRIAPLLLLSIVENAFKHGAGQGIGDVTIGIALEYANAQFRCRVSNTCKPGPGQGSSGSIGLPNLRHQLELIYPGKHELTITRTETLFTINLSLDLS